MSVSASGIPDYADSDMYTASPNNKIEYVEHVSAELFPTGMINHFKLVRERDTPVPQAYLDNHNMRTKKQCVGTNSPSDKQQLYISGTATGKKSQLAETPR
jgi:hypothetical protein